MDQSVLQFCLVTDETMYKDNEHLSDIVSSAIKGGVTMVQLREKHSNTKTIIEKALHLKKLLHTTKVPLIINDRVDIALAVDADGDSSRTNRYACFICSSIIGQSEKLLACP